MTVATGIYTALVAKVLATLPTYVELPDSYSVTENPTYLMAKSFAVAFGAEQNNEYHATNLLNFEREFSIDVVNKIIATTNSRSERAIVEKALIEDCYSLIKAFYLDLTLGNVATYIAYTGQTAIEYLTASNATEKFITVKINVSVKYQDTF
jgi:hypothetical protein